MGGAAYSLELDPVKQVWKMRDCIGSGRGERGTGGAPVKLLSTTALFRCLHAAMMFRLF